MPGRTYKQTMTLAEFASRSVSDVRPAGRVRARTLLVIRWLAVTGQAATLVVLHFGFNYPLPLGYAFAAIGVSVILNLVLGLRHPASLRLDDRGAAAFLAYDTIQLAVLLFLTGGLENPFALLMLAPVAVAATLLSLRAIVVVGVIASACASVLAVEHLPLPWPTEPLVVPGLFVFGQWVAIVVALVFLSAYLWRVSAESRRMSDALVATQLVLAREQRLSAVGGLAAAAAHELGTPLGTIVMAAKEMAHAVPKGSAVSDDVELILREARRCREILGQIARRPDSDADDPFHRVGLADRLREVASHHHREGVTVEIDAPGSDVFTVGRMPEILHGMANLIENAVDFASSKVMIQGAVGDRKVTIRVLDDGPGFAYDVLSALGEPYVSTRSEGGGLGLGVFISKTLLERTGAVFTVTNRPEGGAKVEIEWPRSALAGTGRK